VTAPPTPPNAFPTREIRHASAVAIDGRAVLIQGPSGSGKSGLALELIAHGATLIADDLARLVLREGWPWVLAPERLAGVIEARGVGLVRTAHSPGAPLTLVVDLSEAETERLPEPSTDCVLGHDIARLRRVDASYFPGAIVAVAKGGIWQDV
jgi:HPr kinase/phosphorylase